MQALTAMATRCRSKHHSLARCWVRSDSRCQITEEYAGIEHAGLPVKYCILHQMNHRQCVPQPPLMYASGESAGTIAATLGVSRATVYRLLAERSDNE
jgi:hypothetical protein